MKKLLLLLVLLPTLALAQQRPPTVFISATPTVDTSAYATGDLIGTKLTFANAVRGGVGTGYLVSVEIADKSAQAVDFELVIFCQDPTGTTFTDQAAFDPTDTDLLKICATVKLESASVSTYSDNGVKYISQLIKPIRALNTNGGVGTDIYGALVPRGAPTFAAAADVKITLGISQD